MFTDTFNLGEAEGQFAEALPVNSARAERQQSQDITVIVGNPPYSIGQRSTLDENPNVSYPHMEERVRETYALQSKANRKNSLYDSYKLALRWASDRIGDEGVIAFVTNGSFIDGNAESGLRACLADEFSHLYVFNLRGNQRTQGERSRREGGKIFGSGSRTPVAIMVLVRDPGQQGACRILYRDIGDYLSREKKLQMVQETGSIAGMSEWAPISPDVHHDWLDLRDPTYQRFIPLAIKVEKGWLNTQAVFVTFSLGIITKRDAWIYSFDRRQMSQRLRAMTTCYETRRAEVTQGRKAIAEAIRYDPPNIIKWSTRLKDQLAKNISGEYDHAKLCFSLYRPFTKQYVYYDSLYVERVSRIPGNVPHA